MHDMVASCKVPGSLQPWVSVCGLFSNKGTLSDIGTGAVGCDCIFLLLCSLPHHAPFLLCGHLLFGDRSLTV